MIGEEAAIRSGCEAGELGLYEPCRFPDCECTAAPKGLRAAISALSRRGFGMRRVILESPYAGDIEANVAYARQCVMDCLRRGEAPIASHLLFTQAGILRDAEPEERKLGIAAGLAWLPVAEAMVVYTDRGVSYGMGRAVDAARKTGLTVEMRSLGEVWNVESSVAGSVPGAAATGRQAAAAQPGQGVEGRPAAAQDG